MYDALEERIFELERILGLSSIDESRSLDLDVSRIKRRLKDLKLEFILELPLPKLQRLRSVFNDEIDVPLKDKVRSINFSWGLMRKRAELLMEVKKLSDLVFESDSFENANKCSSTLAKVSDDIQGAFTSVSEFDAECTEFYDDLQTILAETRARIDESSKIIKSLENSISSKA